MTQLDGAAVQLAVLVLKNAQVGTFFGQLGHNGAVVGIAHAQQDDKARPDGPGLAPVDGNACAGDAMNIQHIHGVPPLYTNTFLIITNAKHGILIDAAAEPGVYLKALDEAGAMLTHILLTHGHYDHVGAVAALKKATGCKVYMDPVDAQGSQLLPLTPDVLTDNWPANDELTIDELTFKIYHTPGHTGGGVCLSCYGLLFSGDTLFAGSCGRTDFPGGSMQEMAKSLSLLAELPLPDATKVLPGHEGFSTLGQERSTNPYMNGAWY